MKWHNLRVTNRGSPLQVVNNNLRIIEENLRTLESDCISEQQISGDAAECQKVIMSILRMNFQQVNNTFKQLKELRKKKQKEKVFFVFTSSHLFRMILVPYYVVWVKCSSNEKMLPLETSLFHKNSSCQCMGYWVKILSQKDRLTRLQHPVDTKKKPSSAAKSRDPSPAIAQLRKRASQDSQGTHSG